MKKKLFTVRFRVHFFSSNHKIIDKASWAIVFTDFSFDSSITIKKSSNDIVKHQYANYCKARYNFILVMFPIMLLIEVGKFVTYSIKVFC